MNLLADKNKIIYLSARDYSLRDLTKYQLEYYGFPEVKSEDELILLSKENCPKEWNGKYLDEFHELSLKFKKEALCNLKSKYNIIAGIGDAISDLEACNDNNILTVMLKTPSTNVEVYVKKHPVDPYSYIVLDVWEEIYQYISAITSDSRELKEICIQHSNDYSKWMYDLDNKAYLILVAATFCITSFISLLGNKELEPLYIKVIILIGIVTSALSMFFAVQAFASRNTHGRSELNDKKSNIPNFVKETINKFINVVRVLLGKPPLYAKSIADVIQSNTNKEQVNKSEYAKVAYLRYFKERYKRLNPDEIISKTLFNLRDANYKKILSERYARFSLNITLIAMVIVAVYYIFGIDIQETVKGSESYFISDTENYETILRLDDNCFDDEQLSLSIKGKQLLQAVCENSEDTYLICEIVSSDTYINDKIRNYYNSIKFELVKEYVNDIQRKKEVILIVQ